MNNSIPLTVIHLASGIRSWQGWWVHITCIALFLSACGHTPTAKDVTPPDRLKTIILQDLARSGESNKHTLRYNPVTCRCPAFELELGARWVRVSLSQASKPNALFTRLVQQAKDDQRNNRLKNYAVYGSLSSTVKRCGQGAPYLTLTLAPDPDLAGETDR